MADVLAEGYNVFDTKKSPSGTVKYLSSPADVITLIQMLLWMSRRVSGGGVGENSGVDLTREIAFQAPHYVLFGESLSSAS